MESILAQIKGTIQKHRMLLPGEAVLVACSGGADSVALTHFLRELAPQLKLRLSLLHLDHVLRPGSSKDLSFVRRVARQFKIPFYGAKRKAHQKVFPKGLSPEEAARQIRYDYFQEVSKKTGIRKIALGHHQDDQAETILMRVIQGTGLRGLQGIRPVVQREGMTLIRPLSELSRREIRDFLRKRSIAYRKDPTNHSSRFLRNRIRRELLPLIEKRFNPQIREALCRLAETATAESAGLEAWAKKHWRNYLRSRRNGTLWLDRGPFLALPSALQFRILDRILHFLDPRSGLSFASWERIEQGFLKSRYRTQLPRSLDLILTPKKLSLKKG